MEFDDRAMWRRCAVRAAQAFLGRGSSSQSRTVVPGGQTGFGGRARQWLARGVIAGSLWLCGTQAQASSGERVVPDLRNDPQAPNKRSAIRMRIPLTLHVATTGDRTTLEPRRLDRAMRRANEALRQFGIEVYVARVVLMPEGYTEIRNRRHRRALAGFAPNDGTVHVFLVNTVELGSWLRADRGVRGLHWRYRGLSRKLRNREYLVLGSDAPATTLVHELGHLFGLDHDFGQQNLMCSCRQGPQQVFTRAQGVEIRRGAAQFVSRIRG
jgi:hypothetical protein